MPVTDDLLYSFFDWLAGCVLIYAFLFGVGKLIFGDLVSGSLLLGLGLLAGGFIYWDLSRRGWKSVAE